MVFKICVLGRRKFCVYIGIVSCLYLVFYLKQSQNNFSDLFHKTNLKRCNRGRCINIQYPSDTMKQRRMRMILDKKSPSLVNKVNPSIRRKTRMEIELEEYISDTEKNTDKRAITMATLSNEGKTEKKNQFWQHESLHQSRKLEKTTDNQTIMPTFKTLDVNLDQPTTSTTSISTDSSHQLFPSNVQPKRRPPGYVNVFKPPLNEEPIRRFPQSVVIGFGKCGTRAILNYLSLHPYVVTHRSEIHFYDRDDIFVQGFDWYRNQMPRSYSNQVTIEKTPAYVLVQRARDEIYKLTPGVKLIVLVRDPVVRLVSHFMLKYRNVLPFKDISVTAVYRDKDTNEFTPDSRPVVAGIYYRHLKMWLERFPRKQFLILNAEELTANPFKVMKQVERFLGIPSMFREWNFYFNKTSGFFCPRGFKDNAIPQCLGELKGVRHPKLPRADEKMLYEFYRPFNEKFFHLIGQRFQWTEREWERYQ